MCPHLPLPPCPPALTPCSLPAIHLPPQHYTDLKDIKRCIVNTHALDPAALTEFFGTMSAEWALENLKELLVANPQQNLQLVVNIAKEYTEQLGAGKIIELLEAHQSWTGLYFYLVRGRSRAFWVGGLLGGGGGSEAEGRVDGVTWEAHAWRMGGAWAAQHSMGWLPSGSAWRGGAVRSGAGVCKQGSVQPRAVQPKCAYKGAHTDLHAPYCCCCCLAGWPPVVH